MTNIAIANASRPASKAKPRSPSNRADAKPAFAPTAVSKSAVVAKLLARPKGATVDEVITATGWQPHSVRAFLSGLRKRGQALIREERKDGRNAYRVGAVATALLEDAGSVTPAGEA
jgi:threonine dehydrogenase-like Zn-dependent dehydrogenase